MDDQCAGRDICFVLRSCCVPAVHRFPQRQEGSTHQSQSLENVAALHCIGTHDLAQKNQERS